MFPTLDSGAHGWSTVTAAEDIHILHIAKGISNTGCCGRCIYSRDGGGGCHLLTSAFVDLNLGS